MPSQSLITELAFLPFPEHINLHDPSTPAGAVWQRVLVTVSHAPGYRGSHWGYQLNKPGVVWYLVDWASIEAHTIYATTREYAELNEILFPFFAPYPPAPPPYMIHARFPPETSVWDGEVARVFAFFIPLGRPREDVEQSCAAAVRRLEATIANEEGLISVAGGWVEESVAGSAEVENRCRVFVLVQAWSDLEQLERKVIGDGDGILGDAERLFVKCDKSIVQFRKSIPESA